MFLTKHFRQKSPETAPVSRQVQKPYTQSQPQSPNQILTSSYPNPKRLSPIQDIPEASNYATDYNPQLQQLKNHLVSYINQQISDYQLNGLVARNKQQAIQLIQESAHDVENVARIFVDLIKQVYSRQRINPLFLSNASQVLKADTEFRKVFQNEYNLLLQENAKINLKFKQQIQSQTKKLKQLQTAFDKLENENFTLKEKLQLKAKRCLQYELQRINTPVNPQNDQTQQKPPQPSSVILQSPPQPTQNPVSPSRSTPFSMKVTFNSNPNIHSNLNPAKISRQDSNSSRPLNVFGFRSLDKTPPKKSVFNFKPCVELWKKQGIHADKIKELTECKQCLIYQEQIYELNQKIGQLQKGLQQRYYRH